MTGASRNWKHSAVRLAGVIGIAAAAVFSAHHFRVLGQGLFRNRSELQTRGMLDGLRASVSNVYGDQDGVFPEDLDILTRDGRYMKELPKAYTFEHGRVREAVLYDSRGSAADSGAWGYVNDSGDADFGTVFVDCTHTDLKGAAWSSY